MLLVRVCLFISSTVTSDKIEVLIVVSFFMAIAVLSELIGGAYHKLYINIIEASFILNICILSSATQVAGRNQAVATYLSVGIAFAEFVGILIFHSYLSIKNAKFFHEWKYVKHVGQKFLELKTTKTSSVVEETVKSTTTSTLVEIREPLLESGINAQ